MRRKAPDSDAINVEDPTNIATGTDVDPEAEHIPDDVARDIERLRASVDEEHDFGASYDFTPSTVDRPTDTADVTEGVASEVATSSVDYTFPPPPSRMISASRPAIALAPHEVSEMISAQAYHEHGRRRWKRWRTWRTHLPHFQRRYDMDVVEYDFDTSDLYDFTPPEYDEPDTVSRTTEEAIETDALEEAALASRGMAPTDNPSGDQTSDASTSTSTSDRPALFSDDVVAVGSRVTGVSTHLNGHSVKRTNEGVTIGCIARLFAIICVLTGLAYLVLAM